MSGVRSTAPRPAGVPRRNGGASCSATSRAVGETPSATASPGLRWLLVEVAGAWGWDAFTESPALDPTLGRAIVARAQQAGMRVAAIRRPGRGRGSGRWRWAVVDTAPGGERIRWGEAAEPADLLAVPLDGSVGRRDERPLVLVCAHGRHDECCAVRGRSAAAAIAARYPDETWECSHIGGDRFAATTLLFPHGLNHGQVDETTGPRIVREYLAGRIEPAGYRGRTAHSRVVQAAQDAARLEHGDSRVDAYAPLEVVTTADGWRVRLAADPPVEVAVVERHGEALLTTCRATVPLPVPVFSGAVLQPASGS